MSIVYQTDVRAPSPPAGLGAERLVHKLSTFTDEHRVAVGRNIGLKLEANLKAA